MIDTPLTSQPFLDRSQPPQPKSPIRASFPVWHEAVLPNGLKIMVYEQHDTPVVSIRLYSRAGSLYDGEHQKASMFTFALLMQGTRSRSAEQIANEADLLGAELGTFAGLDSASVSLSVMTKYLDQGLALMSDVVLNPTFEEKELEFVRQQSLNRLRFSKSDATRLASDAFTKAIYQPHPYSQPMLGTQEALQALTREAIVGFYEAYVVPNNSFMVVAGDVKTQEIVEKLAKAFGEWSAKALVTSDFPIPTRPDAPRVILVQKEGAVQSVLMLGHLSIARAHPDYLKCYVMNMMLGGYFGSRLNLRLREQRGYTYNIRSAFDAKRELGDFYIFTQVRKEVTKQALQDILSELQAIIEYGVSEEELQAAKNYIAGNFIIQNESPETILSRLATIELYGLSKDYFNVYVEQLQRLTLDDVSNAAKMYIHPSCLTYVVAGDADAVRADLEGFGDLVAPDSSNNQ
ncbi:MAG: M16 family metallopeptidase [Candidatus Thermochlorobacter sp.]